MEEFFVQGVVEFELPRGKSFEIVGDDDTFYRLDDDPYFQRPSDNAAFVR
jgi:hypothetical protein